MSDNLSNNTLVTNDLLLQAINLSHKFDYELFNNINLSLHKKESIAIIGTSGSGKSTLLNILSSLLKPTTGEIFFKQKDLYSLNKNDILDIRRENFGIIFQAHYLFRGFTGTENLKISSLLSNNNIDDDLLKELDIDYIMKQNVGELSGGQQQRLSIARILTKKPEIIFADEPTGNLDKQTASIVMSYLNNYIKNNNAGMILVTHEHSLATKCDKVFELNNFKLQEK